MADSNQGSGMAAATTGDVITACENDALACCPEWCDDEEKGPGDEHGSVCPERLMEPMTKAEFVGYLESAARNAVQSYRIGLDMEITPDDAAEQAVDEVSEVGMCFAGIGSCGRGWCDHG